MEWDFVYSCLVLTDCLILYGIEIIGGLMEKILLYHKIAKVEICILIFKRFIRTNDTCECDQVSTYTAIRSVLVG
jgi:hypothetical protein